MNPVKPTCLIRNNISMTKIIVYSDNFTYKLIPYSYNSLLESVDGSLTTCISDGDVDVHLTSHTDVNLSTACGDVNITVPEEVSSEVQIQTENLEVDDTLILDIKSRDMESKTIDGNVCNVLSIFAKYNLYDLVNCSVRPLLHKLKLNYDRLFVRNYRGSR